MIHGVFGDNMMTERNLSNTAIGFFLLIYAALFGVLFFSSYQFMWKQWSNSDYNYCYFVPLIAGYLLWERLPALQLRSNPSFVGIVFVCFGIIIYLLGELGGEFYSIYISSWLILVGLLWLHFGWRKLRAIALPVGFLLTMFPFPQVINNPLTLQLKLISSTVGVKIIQLFGVSVFQEGNIIDLGFTRLEVVDACSGLRYLFPLIIVAILVAAQQRARIWQRIVLVLSAVPFSILINSIRLALIAFLYPVLGEAVVDGFWHDFIGWAIFMVSIAGIMGLQWIMVRLQPPAPSVEPLNETADKSGIAPRRHLSVLPMAAAAILLLASTAAVTRTIDFREQVAISKPLAEFPLEINGWQGTRSTLEPVYLDVLHLSDYLLADYRNTQGQAVNFYVAYNASQRKGQSSHSPGTCLPGSGWVFKESGFATLPVGWGGEAVKVRRAFMIKDGERMVGYYWFPQRGRVLTNMFQLKWFTFLDALTKQRTDGALVRLLTPVKSGEEPAEAEKRLQEFARLMGPQLSEFLPGS